jgi:pilus assembly protein FimV
MVRKSIVRVWLIITALWLPTAADAVGLGKLTVTSGLGQPLRGEIALVAVEKGELDSLSARIASFDAFRDAKIERAPVLSSVRITVEQRKNGEPYLRITSTQPVVEPFLDLLVELDWPSGRLIREYTVLLDPPGNVEPQAVAPVTVPAVSAAPKTSGEEQPRATVSVDGKPAAQPEKSDAKPQPETYGPVKRGENLGRIASELKPEGVSLDQMLVSLFRANQQAFSGNNMNRLKTGQILRVPESAETAAIAPAEAAKEIRAHAADWNAYRQKLAAAVAQARPEEQGEARQAVSGKITTAVEDKAAAAQESSRDVLKLSKGQPPQGAAGEAAALQQKVQSLQEEAVAREKAIREANERIAALEKNIREMRRLLEIKSQTLAQAQKRPEPQPAAVEQGGQPRPSAPVTQKPAGKPNVAARPEPSLIDALIDNPLYVGGGAAGLLVLALLGIRVVRARREKQPEAFAGAIATGGWKAAKALGEGTGGAIDTGNDTSFLTDFSQAGLGTIDTNDVDPVAEAEVYMAYGRDVQAEEILTEAMAKDPTRHEIRLKLLEIYVARKDAQAFENLARELYGVTGGYPNPIWEKVAEMGRSIDPANPLYTQAEKEREVFGEPSVPLAGTMAGAGSDLAAEEVVDILGEGEASEVSPELDFNLGMEGAAESEPEMVLEIPQAKTQEPGMPASPPDIGFDLSAEEGVAPAELPAEEVALDFDLGGGAAESAAPMAAPSLDAAQEVPEPEEEKLLDFDLDLAGGEAGQPARVEAMEAESVAGEEALNIDLDLGEDESGGSEAVAPLDAMVGEMAEPPVEESAGEGLISADSWKDAVMNLELESARAPAGQAVEAPAGEDASLESGAPDLAEAPALPTGGEKSDAAALGISVPPAEEMGLDFDFSLDQEEPVSAAAGEEAATEGFDLSGLDLDIGESSGGAAPFPESSHAQEVATKLDLAKAYMEMGDKEGAREILQEVLQEGSQEQQDDAGKLLAELG